MNASNLAIDYILIDPTDYICIPSFPYSDSNDMVVKASRRYAIAGGGSIDICTGIKITKFPSFAIPTEAGDIEFYTEGSVRSMYALLKEHGIRAIAPISVTKEYDHELVITVVNETNAAYTIQKGEDVAMIHFTLVPKFAFGQKSDLPYIRRK